MALAIPDTTPADLLARVRGPVKDSRLTYPERVHFEVTDAGGGLWCLATWESEYSPADPEELNGKTVVDIDLDAAGRLAVHFSDTSRFEVVPVPDDGDDAILSWELFTPDGWVLIYGPWGLWRWIRADQPQSATARP
jgi:hypothetical protein